MQKSVTFVNKSLKINMRKKNKYRKVIQRIIEVWRINGSTLNYHFIIKELGEKFKGQFICLGENTTNS